MTADDCSGAELWKECCFGAFFCFDGVERRKKGEYNFTVPCERLLFLMVS